LTGSEGLFEPDQGWLDDNVVLSEYEQLQDVVCFCFLILNSNF